MRYRVLCEEDLMQLLDELNQGHDGVVISGSTEEVLQATIDAWAKTHKINAAQAKHELRGYFAVT